MKLAVIARKFSRWISVCCVLAIGFCLGSPCAFSADATPPCANPESRQLDFWLGDWTVGGPGAGSDAVSKVYLSLDRCLLIENWDGGRGHTGQNTFAYSSDDGSWHGMFADNRGRVHVFEGKAAADAVEFVGPSRGPQGEADLNRVRIVRVGPDKVEQIWEKSSDHGDTWTTEFRGEYQRKKS